MSMYNPNELWVAYIGNFNGNTFEERTKIFTLKAEAEKYQDDERRENYMYYTVSTLAEYIEYQYESGKEYGEDSTLRNFEV